MRILPPHDRHQRQLQGLCYGGPEFDADVVPNQVPITTEQRVRSSELPRVDETKPEDNSPVNHLIRRARTSESPRFTLCPLNLQFLGSRSGCTCL